MASNSSSGRSSSASKARRTMTGIRGPASLKVPYSMAGSSSTHYPRRNRTNGKSRFGTQSISNPSMIEDLFGIRYDRAGDYGEVIEDEGDYQVDSNALYPDEPYQLEFDFKTTDELEYDLRFAIAKYEHAIERMGEYAVNWHYLMEDLEANPHLAKMFMDIQTMRKLGGGGVPNS